MRISDLVELNDMLHALCPFFKTLLVCSCRHCQVNSQLALSTYKSLLATIIRNRKLPIEREDNIELRGVMFFVAALLSDLVMPFNVGQWLEQGDAVTALLFECPWKLH
jgi:hypothetical protein